MRRQSSRIFFKDPYLCSGPRRFYYPSFPQPCRSRRRWDPAIWLKFFLVVVETQSWLFALGCPIFSPWPFRFPYFPNSLTQPVRCPFLCSSAARAITQEGGGMRIALRNSNPPLRTPIRDRHRFGVRGRARLRPSGGDVWLPCHRLGSGRARGSASCQSQFKIQGFSLGICMLS